MTDKDADRPAWTDADLRSDPHAAADKRSRVRRMFAAIAPKYDLNNRLHSFGLDQRWRRRAVDLAALSPGEQVVDVACGTGDLSVGFANRLQLLDELARVSYLATETIPPTKRSVLGVDFTYAMLPLAEPKTGDWIVDYIARPDRTLAYGRTAARRATYINADATALPLADASADVVSIAFGLRNVDEPAKALAEFHRVLRPGGRVIVLEFSRPRNRVIRFFNDLYCAKIMPHTATWLSGDTSGAYKYLPTSVATFMDRDAMKRALADAGFVDVTDHPMTFGVAVVYRGYKR